MAQVVLRLTLGTNAVGPFSIYTGSTSGTPILTQQTRDQLVAGVVYDFPATSGGTQYTLTFENNQPGCEDQTVTKNIIIYGDTEVVTITTEYGPGSVVATYTVQSNVRQSSNLAVAFTNLIGKTTGGYITFNPTVTVPTGAFSASTVLSATSENYDLIDRGNVTFSGFTFNGAPAGDRFNVSEDFQFSGTPSPTPTSTPTPTPSSGVPVSPTPTATPTGTSVIPVSPTPTATPTGTSVIPVSPTPTQTLTGVTPTPTVTLTSTPQVTVTPNPTSTPQATVTPSVTPSVSVTNTPGVSATPTPTNSATPTSTPQPTSTVTPSTTPDATSTPTPTSSVTPSVTQTNTATVTPSNTSTPTQTPQSTSTPVATSTSTPTSTPVATSTVTPTASLTPTPQSSATPTPTISSTPDVTPTNTPTSSVTPSVTNTVSPTATPTSTPQATVTPTPSNTPTGTPPATATPTNTASVTPSVTSSVTPTVTPSVTTTSTPTGTPGETSTPTPTASVTPSSTAAVTPTPSVTASVTPSSTAAVTPTPSVTASVTPSSTAAVTPTPSVTASVTPSSTAAVTPTPSATPSSTPQATLTPQPTSTVTPSVTASVTSTPIPTRTPSSTVTPSVTPSSTVTPTASVTPTVSVTPSVTGTPAPTKTPTHTPTPSTTPPAITRFFVDNGPTTGQPLPDQICNNVAFDVFTSDFTLVSGARVGDVIYLDNTLSTFFDGADLWYDAGNNQGSQGTTKFQINSLGEILQIASCPVPPSSTPTSTPTVTPSSTVTPTPSVTPSVTGTPGPTKTPTHTPTPSVSMVVYSVFMNNGPQTGRPTNTDPCDLTQFEFFTNGFAGVVNARVGDVIYLDNTLSTAFDGAGLWYDASDILGTNGNVKFQINPTGEIIGLSGCPVEPTPTQSVTPTVTPTASVTPSVSFTPTPSVTTSVTPSVSFTPTPTKTPTVTPSSASTPPAYLLIEPDADAANIGQFMFNAGAAWYGFTNGTGPTSNSDVASYMSYYNQNAGSGLVPSIIQSTIPQSSGGNDSFNNPIEIYKFETTELRAGTVNGNAWYSWLIPDDSIGGPGTANRVLEIEVSYGAGANNLTPRVMEASYTGYNVVNPTGYLPGTYRLYTTNPSEEMRLDNTSIAIYFKGGLVA